VLQAGGLTDAAMQSIAKQLGFNETVFILQEAGSFRFRYFTPGHEVPVCGHATVAGTYALAENGLIGEEALRILTGAGELELSVRRGERTEIGMRQVAYQDIPFTGSLEDLARVIGLEESALDTRYPIVYASTGLWTLLVPIRRLADFARMRPLTSEFPQVLRQNERCSIHPFTLETRDPACSMHGRHFSGAYAGTVEDPVTGTASGAMGEYYKRYIRPSSEKQVLLVEQGHEIGRDGVVRVEVSPALDEPVTIYGTAVFTGKRTIDL